MLLSEGKKIHVLRPEDKLQHVSIKDIQVIIRFLYITTTGPEHTAQSEQHYPAYPTAFN